MAVTAYTVFWWIRQVVLLAAGGFFLVFGIQICRAAFRLNDPFMFIFTFFASNFIILISAALMIRFILQAVAVVRQTRR